MANLGSDVLYSEMFGGNWSIVIEAYDIDFAVQRDVELVAGILPKATVTVGTILPLGVHFPLTYSLGRSNNGHWRHQRSRANE